MINRLGYRYDPAIVSLFLTLVFSFGDTGSGYSNSSPPPRGGYADINLLGIDATLPTVSQCLDRVHHSTWEPRPENNGGDGYADENHNISSLNIPDVDGIDSGAQRFYLNRIEAVNDANIMGTTDELIQFFSCYWGVDDNSTRARAVIESSWDQDFNGDSGVSWGLLQVKDEAPRDRGSGPHNSTYPDVFMSTGNNLNYALAWIAGCYRGDMSGWIPDEFMNDPGRRYRECVGLWYSGEWRSGNSEYLSSYDKELNNKTWLSSDFPNWSASYTYRKTTCDTLPYDKPK